MDTLTELDLAKLAYPFRREDHEFLQGYVYIQEEAITERLDKIDPCWRLSIDQMTAYGDSIAVHSTLTVKGVSRSNVGGNPVQRDKEEKTKQGDKYVGTGKYVALPLYNQADNGVNAYKAAATDALKRCARMFGIGRYLLSAPKEGKQFDEWLKAEHAAAKTRLDALRQVNLETGEINERPQNPPPPAPPLSLVPSSGTNGGNGQNGASDKFAQQFPATPGTAFTEASLWDATKALFNARTHFDNFLKKHADALQGKTQDEAVAYVRNQHWNWSTDRVTAFAAYGKATFGMTNAEILEALTAIAGHELKRFRDWDRGPEITARAALLAWQGGYVPSNVRELGTEKRLTSDEIGEAVLLCEVYDQQRERA